MWHTLIEHYDAYKHNFAAELLLGVGNQFIVLLYFTLILISVQTVYSTCYNYNPTCKSL